VKRLTLDSGAWALASFACVVSRNAIELACQQLRARGVREPQVALVLGSGLGGLADHVLHPVCVDYGDVSGMPTSAVTGHSGRFVAGELAGVPVIAMQGRVHLYEGHAADVVVRGVRMMCALGARALIVTNAAGGVAPRLSAGTLMLIDDHLNLTGSNCLVGPNDDALGPRFPDMTHAYDPALSALALRVAAQQGVALARGVYAGLLGPSYETPAEIRMLRAVGADAVGMSTVLEVIAARHLGVRCLGVSCITNAAAGVTDEALSHDDVQHVASAAADRLQALITGVIAELGGAA